MKTLDQIKPKTNDVKWRNNILSPEMKDNTWYTFRVIGGVMSYAQHWVKSINQKTGKEIVFPVDCLAWDDNVEDIDRSKVGACPGCQTDIKPRGKYLFNVIDRGVQNYGSSSFIRAFDLPPTAMQKILGLSNLNMVKGQPTSVAHPEYGCDLHVMWTTGNGKGDWSIQKGDRTPLTDVENRAELYDFEDIYVPGDANNARQSLVRAGYFKDEVNTPIVTVKNMMMPPSSSAQMPPSNNPHQMDYTPKMSVLRESAPAVSEPLVSAMPKSLGKPPQMMGSVDKPSCFGAFKGDLDCPTCPVRPSCLVLTQERQD